MNHSFLLLVRHLLLLAWHLFLLASCLRFFLTRCVPSGEVFKRQSNAKRRGHTWGIEMPPGENSAFALGVRSQINQQTIGNPKREKQGSVRHTVTVASHAICARAKTRDEEFFT